MGIFSGPPKPKPPLVPANTPTRADALASAAPPTNFETLISSGSAKGLSRKATTRKRTLIGGA